FQAGGSLTNERGGLISGALDGVQIFGVAGTVANFATITGTVGVAINASDTANNTVTNAGTILGTSGTALVFGGGDDLLVVEPSAVFGGAVANFHPGDTIDF